jgi:hypothetical protein
MRSCLPCFQWGRAGRKTGPDYQEPKVDVDLTLNNAASPNPHTKGSKQEQCNQNELGSGTPNSGETKLTKTQWEERGLGPGRIDYHNEVNSPPTRTPTPPPIPRTSVPSPSQYRGADPDISPQLINSGILLNIKELTTAGQETVYSAKAEKVKLPEQQDEEKSKFNGDMLIFINSQEKTDRIVMHGNGRKQTNNGKRVVIENGYFNHGVFEKGFRVVNPVKLLKDDRIDFYTISGSFKKDRNGSNLNGIGKIKIGNLEINAKFEDGVPQTKTMRVYELMRNGYGPQELSVVEKDNNQFLLMDGNGGVVEFLVNSQESVDYQLKRLDDSTLLKIEGFTNINRLEKPITIGNEDYTHEAFLDKMDDGCGIQANYLVCIDDVPGGGGFRQVKSMLHGQEKRTERIGDLIVEMEGEFRNNAFNSGTKIFKTLEGQVVCVVEGSFIQEGGVDKLHGDGEVRVGSCYKITGSFVNGKVKVDGTGTSYRINDDKKEEALGGLLRATDQAGEKPKFLPPSREKDRGNYSVSFNDEKQVKRIMIFDPANGSYRLKEDVKTAS